MGSHDLSTETTSSTPASRGEPENGSDESWSVLSNSSSRNASQSRHTGNGSSLVGSPENLGEQERSVSGSSGTDLENDGSHKEKSKTKSLGGLGAIMSNLIPSKSKD